MSRTGDNPNGHGQDDVDAIFGEIVADLRAEGVGTRMDTDERPAADSADAEDEDTSPRDDWPADQRGERRDDRSGDRPDVPDDRGRPPGAAGGAGWRTGEVGWDETMLSDSAPGASADDDDEHFVPPEPPPLPKPSRSMGIVALFFVLGLVLLIAPHIIGIGVTVATPLGLLSLAAGLGFLLLHARDDNRPPGSDPDNGAQV